ncbi:MAG TPA: aconitase/3-isopropylmalate dehydratase large subunit family protein [Anaerolineae bacterium]|nr:aconitase/3-isopropylmalate dehydratase large subunit family protein [Anaerolineae bacterium]
MTIIEKIIQDHSDEAVEAGKIVWMRLDARTARDFGGANVVKNYRAHYGDTPVDDPARTFFTFDLVTPANNIPYAINQQICRDWARAQGVRVYDVDQGIGSHVAIENGLAWPGSTFVGTDSHLNILGAIGAFGQGMGDQDIAFAFRAGKTWFEVPHTIKIRVRGELKPPNTAKDLTLACLRRLGASGVLGMAAEFCGPAIDALDLPGRITLASMMTEMGGIIGLIPPSEEVLAYCRARTGRADLAALRADRGARYVQEIEVDITDLEPLVACPPKPDNVKPVREVAGRKVDSVFIGSCTNGRYEDLAAVARIARGRHVAPHMVASIVPATREVYAQILRDGTLQALFDAGFIVSNPGCGGCASGHIGMVGEKETQVSTSNRNFAGKQGPGDIYLASPAVAAWAALTGELTVPEG